MNNSINKNQESVISIAQTLLKIEKDKGINITPALIHSKLKLVSLADQSLEFDIAEAQEELVRRFSYWVGKEATLKDTYDHIDWLNAERKNSWRYWGRLQRYLEKKLSIDVVEALDKSTDGILGLLEDPHRTGAWDRRGLVVGHVQSGKTSSYSALICKAADAGYKIIIVLAGMHNNLRAQTQIRLEEAFLGYETSHNREPGNPIGVFSEDSDPSIHPHCATTRANNGDFNRSIAKHFSISPEERPWLFVVKKNKSVLTELLKWITSNHVADSTDLDTGRRMVTKLPLLIIDDEADHASVDTGEQSFDAEGKPDEEHQPKAINSLIRKLLHSFSKSAYVGYTATPFANIFIHRQGATKNEGPDLFPQSFIVNIAAPSNYIGPTKIFGLNSPDGRVGGLPLTRNICDHASLDGKSGWMPSKHKKDHQPLYNSVFTIPPTLRNAIGSFLIATTVRSLRGQDKQHSSMLIHVTRLNAVQSLVLSQVQSEIESIQRRLKRNIDHESLFVWLETLWEEDFEPTSAVMMRDSSDATSEYYLPSWESVKEKLPSIVADVQVKAVNGNAKDALDYIEHQQTGLKVIAIGGDKLARGLTLEGLCVSYFVRTTKMYDTLMQMGRWFGYRPGYLDLCRLYTTPDLVEWFKHIADASEELREEFDHMAAVGSTPWDYGMKVESHTVMLVTSPLKMRTAKTLSLSYSGSLSQTIVFLKDINSLTANLEATTLLLESIGQPKEQGIKRDRGVGGKGDEWRRSLLWSDVPSDLIVEFLNSYRTPLGVERANSAVMSEFISQMNSVGELTKWTVALMSEGKKGLITYTLAKNIHLDSLPYRGENGTSKNYTIGVLTDPIDEAIDLDEQEWLAALDSTVANWTPDEARNKIKKPERPSGQKIRVQRGGGTNGSSFSKGNGLILLYPLSPVIDGKPLISGWLNPIIGFAISFPASQSGIKVDYKVDHLKWKEWEGEYGPAD